MENNDKKQEVSVSYTRSNRIHTISYKRSETVPPGTDPMAYTDYLYNLLKKAVDDKLDVLQAKDMIANEFPENQQNKQPPTYRKSQYNQKVLGEPCPECGEKQGGKIIKNPNTGKLFCDKRCWLNK